MLCWNADVVTLIRNVKYVEAGTKKHNLEDSYYYQPEFLRNYFYL